MKANFMKKTCAWMLTAVTVATSIVPNTVNVAFAADVDPDTSTSMQIDDADMSTETSITPVDESTDATNSEETADVKEPTQTTDQEQTANNDADVSDGATDSTDSTATVTEAPKTSSVRFSVPKNGGKVVVSTNQEGSQPVDVLTNEKDYSYKLENVEVGTVINTDVQCDNGYDVASYHVLKDTGKGMVELLEANETDRVDLEQLVDFVASSTSYKHNITVGEDPIVVEVVFEETKKDDQQPAEDQGTDKKQDATTDDSATEDKVKEDENNADEDASKDSSDTNTDAKDDAYSSEDANKDQDDSNADETKDQDQDADTTDDVKDNSTSDDSVTSSHKVVIDQESIDEFGAKLDKEDGIYNTSDTVTITMNKLEKENESYSVYATNLNDEDSDKNVGLCTYPSGEDGNSFVLAMPTFDVKLTVVYNENDAIIGDEFKADTTYVNLNDEFDADSLKESDFYVSNVSHDYLKSEVSENTVDTSKLGDYTVKFHVTSDFDDDYYVVFPVSVVEDKDKVETGKYSVSFSSNSDRNVNFEIEKHNYNEGDKVTFKVTPKNGYAILKSHAFNSDLYGTGSDDYELNLEEKLSDENGRVTINDSDTENSGVAVAVDSDDKSAVADDTVDSEEDKIVSNDSSDKDVNNSDSSDVEELTQDSDSKDNEITLITCPVEYSFTMPAGNVNILTVLKDTASTLDIDIEDELNVGHYELIQTGGHIYYKSSYTTYSAMTIFRYSNVFDKKGNLIKDRQAAAYCIQAGIAAPGSNYNMGIGSTFPKSSLMYKAMYLMESIPSAQVIDWGGSKKSIIQILGSFYRDANGNFTSGSAKAATGFTNIDGTWGEQGVNSNMGRYAKDHFILSYMYGYESSGYKTPTNGWYYPNCDPSFWSNTGKTQLNKLCEAIRKTITSSPAVDLYEGAKVVRDKTYKTSELDKSTANGWYMTPVLTYKAPSWNTATVKAPSGVSIWYDSTHHTGTVKIPGGTKFRVIKKDFKSGTVNLSFSCAYNNMFTAKVIKSGNTTYQDIGIVNTGTKIPLKLSVVFPNSPVPVKLKKTSSDPNTSGNSNYDLSGATYYIYTDAGCTKRYGDDLVLTTTKTGESNTVKVPVGTYYAKEHKAPDNFTKCNKAHKIVATDPTEPCTFKCEENPTYVNAYLKKSSDDATVVNGNPCYSLEGAEYYLYTDAACSKRYGDVVLKTDATGKTQTVKLLAGKYWAKEHVASSGYKLCSTPHAVDAVVGKTAVFTCKEKPLDDPGLVRLYKEDVYDADNNLGGAEYTIKFYPNSTGVTTGTPVKQWVMRTVKVGGSGVLRLDIKDNVVSGTYYLDSSKTKILYPLGTYTIQETKAPEGYALDKHVYKAYCRQNGNKAKFSFAGTGTGSAISYNSATGVITHSESPLQYGLRIQKYDDSTKKNTPQGNGSLQGIQFNVIYAGDGEVTFGGDDSKTYKNGDVVTTLTTDKNGVAQTGAKDLYGGEYKIVETRASAGYKVITKSITVDVGDGIKTGEYTTASVYDPIIKGGVKVTKQDAELNKSEAMSGTNLEGIDFQITNISANSIYIEGKEYKPNTLVATITTKKNSDGSYSAETANNLLPYGKYSIKEVKSNKYYKLTDGTAKTFEIKTDGVIVDGDINKSNLVFKNNVYRNDIKLVKTTDSGEKLSVPFEIKNTTTGETHVIVTDNNGNFNSTSVKHSTNTNANDKMLNGYTDETVIKQSDFVYNSGVWFGIGEKGTKANPNDSLGAFPYGTYTITELSCEANEGYKLVDGNFTVSADSNNNPVIDLGTFVNKSEKPEISTTALDSVTKEHLSYAGNSCTVVDTVKLSNLLKGKKYTLKASFVNKADGTPIKVNGTAVVGETTFTATGSDMNVDVKLPMNASSLKNVTGVVYESLYKDGKVVATHEALDDAGQTIYFPEIGTKAVDGTTGINIGVSGDAVTIKDTVFYKNLIPGKKYTLKGNIYNKATSEVVGDEVVKEFTPDSASGTIDMIFSIPSADGMDLVAFESLYVGDSLIADHKDINDEGQTVHYPSITTTAKDSINNNKIGTVGKSVSIIDTVRYSNLIVGKEYTLKAKIMDRGTNSALLVGGKEVTKEVKFTPTKASGSVNVKFTFDTSALTGKTITVFEDLYYGTTRVAIHEDLYDTNQSIFYPSLKTKALDSISNSHVGTIGKTTIVDTVRFTGLVGNNKYVISGTLMDKDTGKELLVNGKPVTASATLTGEDANGSVKLTYSVDSTSIEGKTAVVYETLYVNDVAVASHTDLNDAEQTVHYPKIRTSASDVTTKDGIGTVNGTVALTDKVSYWNLIPGQTYTLKGKVYEKNSKTAVSTEVVKEFTPDTVSGFLNLDFNFKYDAKGKDLVVFEDLYYGGVKVASHSDINDNDQTLHYPGIQTTATDTNSGTHTGTIGKEVTITDTVKYNNLVVGKEYTLSGKLMNKATGKALLVDGKEITSTTKFTADKKDGSVDIRFTLNSSSLMDVTTVVFENLSYKGITVATHSDINDEGQSVHFPKLKTNATDGVTGTHVGTVGKTKVVDKVTYNNLIPGKEYTVSGKLMDKDTGKEFTVGGKTVTASKVFTPSSANGVVELVYELDASALEGKTLVVFEDLIVNGKNVVSHADINDNDQTVHYPKIRTKANDPSTKDGVGSVKETTNLTDTVSYWNLIPGVTYTVKGTVYEKSSNKAVSSEVTKEFTPTKADGTVSLDFSFKYESKGKDFVVFEDLYNNGKKVASHSDINDDDQTLHYPDISTTAIDENSGTHTGTIGKSVTIVDTVKYTNLVVGKEYKLSGKLMNKGTGKALVVDGKEVTNNVVFTPKQKDGSVEIKFTLNSSALEDVTTVVFEDLMYKDLVVTTHSDINDENQSVHFPKLRTHAKDSITGDHVGTLGKTTVVDTVSYNNLIPGKEYTVSGKLMDKETGKAFMVNGKEVITSKTFTPDKANGTVELVYELDASALEGKTLVVFEDLYTNGKKVTSHADINDEDQTVHYPKVRTSASDVNTKDEVGTVKETTTLTDAVSYWNLIPGQTYVLKGTVYDRESQKAVSSEVTKEFVPSKANDTINLDFSFKSDAEGKDFVVFEKLYHNDKQVASHSDINDKDQMIHYPKIRTTAVDKNSGTHTGTIGKSVTIIDTVKYNNLVVGKEYTLSGKLMNKETGKPITVNGKEITSMITFTPDKKDGSIEMKFTLDSSALEDVTTVVYENLSYKKVTVTTHSDINDEDQTVHFPKIRTHAVDSTTGNHVGTVGKTKVIDTVTYSNLIPGKEYTIKGTLMDKETGKSLIVNDKEVTATKTFVPEESKGSVDLVYVFDASALEGKSVVVFEDLYNNGKKVTSHADINDEDQTVHYPKIRTKATDKNTGLDETLAKGDQTIIDTVSYENLVIGEKYIVKGKLMDKSTGTALLVNGKEVAVEKEFTADKVKGTIDLEFTLDASSLEGKTTVVFEDLYNSDVKVTTHSDIKDEGQTIRLPKVTTNALDKDSQLNEGMSKKEVTVVDKVNYYNLKKGETYKVSGVLMDKDTGEKFLVNGEPVTTEKEFVAEDTDGFVTLEFTFDGSALENKTLVVFEDLYHSGKHVGTHTDITDEDQTVRYPKIRTSAIDKETQFKESNADNDVTVVDTVSCWNLTEGNTYTIKGKLMDKSTGEPLLVDGKEVTSEKTFVASARDGVVDLEFKFDGTSLKGKTLVVFEDLFRDGKQLATHSDLNDHYQTTHLPKIATKAYDKDSQIDEAIAKKETTIIDEVSYENLTDGVEYTIKGTLMDKATGKPLLVNGEEVHSEKTFIAGKEGATEEPKDRVSGMVSLEFTFDSSALEGQDLVVFEEMFREGKEVAFHTDITDGNQTVKFPKLRTSAVDGETNLDEGLGGSSEQKVVDTVSYWNLKPGTTYKIKGILMDKETGKPFLAGENEDQEVTVEKEFTPETADGTIDLEFVFDGIYTASKTVVAFEDLYKEDHHVATHTDITDEDQDVKYPDIKTHALDKENGLNESVADEEVTIVDTVSYTNLTVGNTYTITGKLMDKETGEPLLVDDQEVTASKEFIPEETEGTVDIEFTFNGSALKGKTTVAFETLTREDKVVGVHADIEDGEQTVYFPEVLTTASDKESGTDEGVFGKESTIVDVVKYNNLSEGVEYTVKGTLMDKETGEALLVNGKEVTAEKTFVAGSDADDYVDGAIAYPPKRVSGEVSLEFTFDSSALAGKSVVVFERVYIQDKEVAVHTDITDEGQTVTYPEVKTTATDKKTGTHEQEAAKKVTVVDVVKYSALKVGKEYTVKGILMDKETGKELLVNNKTVEVTKTFKTEKSSGEVTLEFTFDSSAIAGKTVVVFENLYRDDINVAVHADINDKDQSVNIISIGTKAQDVKSKSSTMTVDKEAKLKDIVSFKGLTVGKQYTLKGVVMDKATSKQVFVDGRKVEATTTFIPKKSDGTADVVFTLNTTKLQGRELVVFEELYDKDNVKVAEHKDIKDKDQTVSVPVVPSTLENPSMGGGSSFARTGENALFVLSGIMCLLASVGLFGVVVRGRRRKRA